VAGVPLHPSFPDRTVSSANTSADGADDGVDTVFDVEFPSTPWVVVVTDDAGDACSCAFNANMYARYSRSDGARPTSFSNACRSVTLPVASGVTDVTSDVFVVEVGRLPRRVLQRHAFEAGQGLVVADAVPVGEPQQGVVRLHGRVVREAEAVPLLLVDQPGLTMRVCIRANCSTDRPRRTFSSPSRYCGPRTPIDPGGRAGSTAGATDARDGDSGGPWWAGRTASHPGRSGGPRLTPM
jgi:hypothetical protein